MPELLFPFLGVVALLTVTPGPDMLLVVRNGLAEGTRAAWRTGLGCCLGISVHATAAVLGLSAIFKASPTAYAVVRFAGAGYLAYLGIRMAISAIMAVDDAPEPATPPPAASIGPATPAGPAAGTPGHQAAAAPDGAGRGAFRQGLLTNLLNPKIALLFLTLLPQFVAAGEPRLRTTAILAGVFLAIAVLWWRAFSLALGPISRLLRDRRARRVLDGVAGTALLAVSAAVAFEGGR